VSWCWFWLWSPSSTTLSSVKVGTTQTSFYIYITFIQQCRSYIIFFSVIIEEATLLACTLLSLFVLKALLCQIVFRCFLSGQISKLIRKFPTHFSLIIYIRLYLLFTNKRFLSQKEIIMNFVTFLVAAVQAVFIFVLMFVSFNFF